MTPLATRTQRDVPGDKFLGKEGLALGTGVVSTDCKLTLWGEEHLQRLGWQWGQQEWAQAEGPSSDGSPG